MEPSLSFEQIEEIWLDLDFDSAQEVLRNIKVIACGFDQSILYQGSKLASDALISLARNQYPAFLNASVITEYDFSMYYLEFNESKDLVHIRNIYVQRTPRHKVKPFFFVILGTANAVKTLSAKLNALIIEQQAKVPLFKMLISVPGIGMHRVRSIIHQYTSSELCNIFLEEQVDALAMIPNIPHSLAENTIAQLRDQIRLIYKEKHHITKGNG
jgi:hypothetical protein